MKGENRIVLSFCEYKPCINESDETYKKLIEYFFVVRMHKLVEMYLIKMSCFYKNGTVALRLIFDKCYKLSRIQCGLNSYRELFNIFCVYVVIGKWKEVSK